MYNLTPSVAGIFSIVGNTGFSYGSFVRSIVHNLFSDERENIKLADKYIRNKQKNDARFNEVCKFELSICGIAVVVFRASMAM